jgi:hypothetical protein
LAKAIPRIVDRLLGGVLDLDGYHGYPINGRAVGVIHHHEYIWASATSAADLLMDEEPVAVAELVPEPSAERFH